MVADIRSSTVAKLALQTLPLSSVIEGPLRTTFKAQAIATKICREFIQQVDSMADFPYNTRILCPYKKVFIPFTLLQESNDTHIFNRKIMRFLLRAT